MREDQIISQQYSAESYARVRHIECRPVVLPRVQQDEIDHKAKAHPVSEVADDARQQQRRGSENSIVVARRAKEIKEHGSSSDPRQHNEEPATKRAAFLQLAERNPAIFGINKIERAANYCDVLKTKTPDRPRLA